MRVCGVLLFCYFLFSALPVKAYAGEPQERVKSGVDSVIGILEDEELKKPEKTGQRRAAIRKAVEGVFDFREMAKRSLARHWRKRTAEERTEFVGLYTDLIENAYIGRIERYENEEVVYLSESVNGKYASVKTNVITPETTEIPMEYRLIRKDLEWWVYDVVIEGVSLVNNYRTQFREIIRSGSYEKLVERIRKKLERKEKPE